MSERTVYRRPEALSSPSGRNARSLLSWYAVGSGVLVLAVALLVVSTGGGWPTTSRMYAGIGSHSGTRGFVKRDPFGALIAASRDLGPLRAGAVRFALSL